ncbi:MAG: type VI secretion system protein TssA [Gammaproteobacteria bacterium]|nr:type VI secretion system protein TssA [Gammaproteobacteria bacterium]
MSLIDVKSLLKEVSTEVPCGENLEYDPEFGEMQRTAQGKPEQQIGDTLIPAQEADSAKVLKKAVKLFGRTKDLRVAVNLTQALIHTDGLTGLRDGLVLIQGLLESYWDAVHPRLDPTENNDPTLRINTLASLCDSGTVLHSVRETTLVNSTVFGRLSLRDILIALGKLSLPSGSKEQPIEVSTINGAFMDASLDELKNTADAIRQAIECVAAIESLLMMKVGAMQMADFSTLPNLLKEAQQVMSEHLTQRGAGDTTGVPSEIVGEVNGSQTVSGLVGGKINSREDVIRVLDMACDYFVQHEPSSPVPLLLQRAKRLVAKDFMEILRELTPAGVTQAEEVIGVLTQKQ